VRSVEMDEKSREILEAALSLPEDQRASLIEALLQTLPSDTDEWDDDELASELDRRLDEALGDPSSTVSWTDLKNRRRTPRIEVHGMDVRFHRLAIREYEEARTWYERRR
jgi:putative addiction module component (TIGR02574 family)